MKILRAALVSLLLFEVTSVFALDPPKCSPWTEQDGVVCIFAGETASLYRRQCENACGFGIPEQSDGDAHCNREQVCHFNSPNTFRTVCSDWVKESNMNCYNPNSGSLEQLWVRACTINLRESWCSDMDPNLRL